MKVVPAKMWTWPTKPDKDFQPRRGGFPPDGHRFGRLPKKGNTKENELEGTVVVKESD